MAYDANGFTEFTLAGDAKAVYVADDGNDSNDGLTDSTPKLTIAAGYALLTSGKPDWLLLKRGSVWDEALGHWRKVGRSASEPMRIAAYGTGARPLIALTTSTSPFYRSGGSGSPASIDYIALQGIEITAASPPLNSTVCFWLGPGSHLLIEDCVFAQHAGGISVQKDASGRVSNVTIRRNIIRDNYYTSGHVQGIFCSGVDGLIIEENVIDNNGTGGDGPTVFKHNIYISTDNTDVHIRNNLLTRASSHGCQLRAGGELNGNVVIQCPLALLLGGGDPVAVSHTSGITGEIRNNVVLEGTDIDGSTARGWGIQLTNIGLLGAMVADNVIANKTTTNAAGAIMLTANSYGSGVGCSNVKVRRNTIYNWRGGIDISTVPGSPPSPSTFVAQAGHSFRNNNIQSDIAADSATLVATASGADPANFLWDGNNYYRDSGGNEFTDEGVARAYAAWVTAAGETDSSNTQTAFPDTAKTLQAYIGAIAGDSSYDFDDAIDRLQEQSSQNWDERLRIQRIAAALRQGWIAASWMEEVCLAIWAESTRELLTGSPHASGSYLQNICNEGWNETVRNLTIPAPPTSIQVISFTTTTAQITAIESVTAGITRYRAYRGTSSGNLSLVADTTTDPSILYISSGDVVYEPTGLSPGTTYYVALVAVEDGVESNPTSEASFTTGSLPSGSRPGKIISPITRPIVKPVIRGVVG